VPSVAVHTQRFARLCNATALSMGMPRLRQAYTPHPVVDQSPEHLRAYIDGSDAISGRPFMQVVLDGLTGPLEDGLRIVREGLKPEDRVVINGLMAIRPGVPVKAEETEMKLNAPAPVAASP
jgi:hypothetical protein